jgi:Cu/Ag efflux protein CusF
VSSSLPSRVGVALLGLCLACGAAPPKPDGSYHARGVVAAVSGKDEDASLSIHHEAIPQFKDRDGHPLTMGSMTMIFGLGPGLSTAGVRSGDKIAFDFAVRWSTSPALLLTKFQKLPADTQLTLSADH